jgi:hypothetical protein
MTYGENESTTTLELHGLTAEDIARCEAAFGVSAQVARTIPVPTRATVELFSAAFLLGVINATPALIKAISDMLADLRRARYFTMKVTLDDGKTVIEGAVSPERISELSTTLNRLRELKQ